MDMSWAVAVTVLLFQTSSNSRLGMGNDGKVDQEKKGSHCMLATLCNYSGNAKTVMVIDLIVSSDRPILLPERRWDSPKKIPLDLTLA